MSSQTNVSPSLKTYLSLLTIFWAFLLMPLRTYATDQWRNVGSGIEYRDLEGGLLNPWSHIHVFRIDLSKNKLDVVAAKDLGSQHAAVDQLVEHNSGVLGVNGGFFDNQFKPLGLRIHRGHTTNPLKRISWWGVFYVENNKAYISSMQHFQQNPGIQFAIQSGPRLVIDGRIPSLKPGADERTAIGITAGGKIIILITASAAMSPKELARIMKAPPLSCINAINLDGGSSTQLYANINAFKLSVRGFSNVSDAVVVKSK